MPLGLVLWLVSALASVNTWEHQHDEGIAFDIAIGALQPFSLDGSLGPEAEFPADPIPVTALIDQLDGGQRGPGDVVRALQDPNRMPHPPAFYLALNAWSWLTGGGKLALRIPALLLGLASLLGVLRVARRLVPTPGAAELALLFMALSPWFVSLTTFLRPYSLVLCASIWATVAVVSMSEERARRAPWMLLFVIASLTGLMAVYHYAFVFAWHGILLVLLALTSARGTRVRRLVEAAGLGVVVLLGTAPWWSSFADHLATTADSAYYFTNADPLEGLLMHLYLLLGRFSLGEAFVGLFRRGGRGLFMMTWLAVTLITLVLGLCSFRRGARHGLDRVVGLTWVSAVLLPLSILAADMHRGTGTFWVAKYGFGMFPLGVLFVVRAWTTVGWMPWRRIGIALCLTLLATGMVSMINGRMDEISGMERVALIAAQYDDPSHVLVMSSFNRRFGTLQVLTLRDHGVRHVRVVRCAETRLPYLLKTMQEDPDVQRLTLVQFAAESLVATPEDTEDADMWPKSVVRRLPEIAAARGWRVADIDIQEGTWETTGEGSPLALVHDVVSKTFHGRN